MITDEHPDTRFPEDEFLFLEHLKRALHGLAGDLIASHELLGGE